MFNRNRLPLIAAVVASMLNLSMAGAADWPWWRGPNRDNTSPETGLLKEWPKEGPPLAWKVTDLGTGYSPPSVAGGRVYLVAFRGKDEVVVALDRGNGKEVWATPIVPARENTGMMFLTQRAPVVDGERVYATTTDGTLVCLDVDNGQELWRKNYVKDFKGKAGGWAFGDNPLLDGDKLICTPGGSEAALVALNKFTGEVVWRSVVPGGPAAAYSAATVMEAGGVRQYVQFLGKGLVGVHAKDGQFLWQYNKLVNGTANVGPALVRDNLLFNVNAFGTGSVLLQISAGEAGMEVKELYVNRKYQNLVGGYVVVGDLVYAVNSGGIGGGPPTCMEWKTGKIAWMGRELGAGRSAAVLAAEGHVYFGFQDGEVVLVEASGDRCKVKGRLRLPDKQSNYLSFTNPVLAGGKLFLRNQKVMYVYDLRGKRPQPSPAPSRPEANPQREPDAVFIPTPHHVVDKMLELAQVKKDDVVYDLGSGDGRVVIAAARKYGARGVGIEVVPALVQEARASAKREQVGESVTFQQADLFSVDLSDATVLTLYLLPELNARLTPKLAKLRPGTRIVTHNFSIPGYAPRRVVRVQGENGVNEHTLYLWVTPLVKK